MNVYEKWEVTRVIRMILKITVFYPVMLVCVIPHQLYVFCLYALNKFEYLWWE